MENFPLDSEKIYFSSDMLTLDCESGPVTMKVSDWLHEDPVRIHRMIVKEKVLQVDQMEVFAPLVSKLRRADYDYYKRITGLKMMIDFPGFPSEIEARIPYDTDPISSTNGGARARTNTACTSPPLINSSFSRKCPTWSPRSCSRRTSISLRPSSYDLGTNPGRPHRSFSRRVG